MNKTDKLIDLNMLPGPVVVDVVLINKAVVVGNVKILLHSVLYINDMLLRLSENKTKEFKISIGTSIKSITSYHESFSNLGNYIVLCQDFSHPSKNFEVMNGLDWFEIKG